MLGISGDGVKLGNAANDLGGTGRIIVNCQAVRDIIATVHLHRLPRWSRSCLWSVWQKRGRKKPGDVEEARSRFGRPVLRKA